MTSRLALLRANTRDQVAATVARVRRLSAGPALVRLIAFVAARPRQLQSISDSRDGARHFEYHVGATHIRD